MNYCPECGSNQIGLQIPTGDNRKRFVCRQCHTVYYQNPKIVAGCLATYEQKILICQRAIAPRKGLWTLPAGFMENHETTEQAAQRETWEEARATTDSLHLYTVLNLAHINQVYMIYRARLTTPEYSPGPESLTVELRSIDNIPWEQLAFASIRETLKLYVQDAQHGEFGLHTGDIIRPWVLSDSRHAWVSNLQTRY